MFTEYSLDLDARETDKKHEAGYDALMTGIVFTKFVSSSLSPIKKEFPGMQAVMDNNFVNVSDKNKVPLASIRASLDLTKDYVTTSDKPFLFVIQNVPLHMSSEDV